MTNDNPDADHPTSKPVYGKPDTTYQVTFVCHHRGIDIWKDGEFEWTSYPFLLVEKQERVGRWINPNSEVCVREFRLTLDDDFISFLKALHQLLRP